MDKLDRLLDDIRIGEVEPQDDLIRTTKRAMRSGQKAMEASSSKRSKMTIRMLAAATLVAFVFVVLIATSIANRSPIDGAAYYTIDINPSFGFTVDEDNIVTDVALLDKEAKDLYEGMDCVGLDLEDAIRLIIDKAIALGYMNEDGDTYVLLGQFLKGRAEGDREILDDMVERLEGKLGDEVKLVGVKGDEKDVKEALELEVSPGLLLLCELVEDVEPDDDVKVEDVIKSLPDTQFDAPVISGQIDGNTLYLSWEKVDFSEVEAEGIEVEYKLLKGLTLDEIENKKNIVTKKIVDIDAEQPSSFAVQIKAEDLGKEIYYCLYVRAGHTAKFSNVLPITTQQSDTTTPEPEVTPVPIDEVPEQDASEISATINGEYINIDWTKATEQGFNGYKVMYSSTDSTPVYGEDGCYYLEYVTDINKLSGKYKLSSLKYYKPGKKYYFSITVLYNGQETKVPGNVVSKTMPAATPTDEPTPDEYPSTNISGSRDGDKIYLNWGKITDERLEGYKVVYSFTDSTPVYGSSGTSYLRWITNASTTSTVISLSELGASSDERTCYFSITALYNDHTVKRPGNAIAITIPAVDVPDYSPTTLNYASYNADTKYVSLGWNKIEHPNFEGYKVMYSFTDTNPVYGDGSSYMAWITNPSTTTYSVYAPSLSGYQPGATCYFTVTALYDNHAVKLGSNVKTVTFPAEITYPAANVTSVSDYLVEWSPVSHEHFWAYKVMYEFTDGSGSGIIETLENMSASLSDFNKESLSGYAPGKTCKFYVKTIYYDGVNDYVVTGSSKTYTFPSEVVYSAANLTSATYVSDGQFYLTWSTVDSPDFSEYALYYSINGSGYTACAEITNIATSSKTVTITAAEPGSTVSFKIATFYNGNYSNPYYGSTVKTVTVPAPDPTPTPTVVSASANGGTVTWSWNAIEHELFENFVAVYTVNGTTREVNMGNTATSCTVTITEFEDGAQCTVKVVAVYAGTDNKTSNSKTVTLSAGTS